MRALDARDILGLWEVCPPLHPIDRALAILRVGTGRSWAELAALPIGERERLAAALRVATFGPAAEATDACPACGVAHELELPLMAVIDAPAASAEPFTAEVAELALTLRLPDSRDQAALVACREPARAVRRLLERCVVAARRGDAPVAVDALDDEAVAAIAALLEARDGNADNRLALTCVACGHAWEASLDAGEYLWIEVRDRARRLMYEIDALARAYHWSEDAIVAMSARRRAAYLEMVSA